MPTAESSLDASRSTAPRTARCTVSGRTFLPPASKSACAAAFNATALRPRYARTQRVELADHQAAAHESHTAFLRALARPMGF